MSHICVHPIAPDTELFDICRSLIPTNHPPSNPKYLLSHFLVPSTVLGALVQTGMKGMTPSPSGNGLQLKNCLGKIWHMVGAQELCIHWLNCVKTRPKFYRVLMESKGVQSELL